MIVTVPFFVSFVVLPKVWIHSNHDAPRHATWPGDYHVVGAVRDLEKMKIVAELEGFDMDRFTPMCAGPMEGV